MWARVGLVLLRDVHVGGRLEIRGCRGWKACVVRWGEGWIGGWVVYKEEMEEKCGKGWRVEEYEWMILMSTLGNITSFN